jgi:hypothetical protein
LNNNAATDTGSDGAPELTTAGAGNWIAVWHSGDDLGGTIGTDSDILYTVSTDNGASWSAPAPLNNNAATDIRFDVDPQLTTDGAGNWIAAWHSDDDLGGTIGLDLDVLYALSTDDGASWSTPAPLNNNAATDAGNDFKPQLTTDGTGNWIAVWYSTEDLGGTVGLDTDILYVVSTNDGASWSAPAPLNYNAVNDTGNDLEPQLTTDGAGNWIAIWNSVDDLGGAIGSDIDVLHALSTDDGATWSAPAPLNNNASTDTGSDYEPQLTTDNAGNWIAVWNSADDLGGTVGIDVDEQQRRTRRVRGRL